jgi:hypothetical protein
MQNVWYHLRRPTLVRRIIIAQLLLLTLLWCLFLTFILWEDLRSPPILTGSHTYETFYPGRADGRTPAGSHRGAGSLQQGAA